MVELCYYASTRSHFLIMGTDKPANINTLNAFQSDVLHTAIVKNVVRPILTDAISILSSDHNPLIVTLRQPCG